MPTQDDLWSEIIRYGTAAPNAGKYAYRLYYQDDGMLVGQWGPAVVFTLKQLADYNTAHIGRTVVWRAVGELIYSVE